MCFRTSFGYFFKFDLLAGRLTREFIRRCVLWKTSHINLTVCFELILKIKLENVKWLSSQRNLDEISSKLTYSGQASCRRERDWVRKPVSLSRSLSFLGSRPFLFSRVHLLHLVKSGLVHKWRHILRWRRVKDKPWRLNRCPIIVQELSKLIYGRFLCRKYPVRFFFQFYLLHQWESWHVWCCTCQVMEGSFRLLKNWFKALHVWVNSFCHIWGFYVALNVKN